MLIDSLLPQFPISITDACSCMYVSRSGYYDWVARNRLPYQIDPLEMQLKDEIHQIAIEFPKYRYRRISKGLHRRGFQVNSKRVLEMMREDNLLCIKKTFVPVTTNSNHNHRFYPNIARDMEVTGINQLWIADITFASCEGVFCIATHRNGDSQLYGESFEQSDRLYGRKAYSPMSNFIHRMAFKKKSGFSALESLEASDLQTE